MKKVLLPVAVIAAGALLGAMLHRLDAGMVLSAPPVGGGNAPVNTGAPTLTDLNLPAFVQSLQYVYNASNASSFTTTNLPSTALGSSFVIGLAWYAAATLTSVTSSNGTTCSAMTGASSYGQSAIRSHLVYCSNNAVAGSVNFTFNMNSPLSVFVADMMEFSGVATTGADAAVGNANSASTGTTLSIATNGNVPDNNDLVVSIIGCSACNAYTPPGAPVSSPIGGIAYQTTSTAGSPVTHAWATNISGPMAASIGVLKHK